MPGPSSGYLPPVVAELSASIGDFVAKMEEAKAILEDFSKTPTEVTITANTAAAIAAMVAARTDLNAMALPPIAFTVAIDSAEALAELAAIRAIAGSAVGTVSIPVTANIAPLVTEMAVARAAADSQGGGNGIIGRLLWGAGGLAGFATAGSIASLAGLGFEHALTTMIGLAGSFAGALGGLGVMAVGVFGKMVVGLGSDMLVMKSTIADTQLLYAALTAIQTAQLTYGKNSAQAAAATQALNVQMLLLGNTAGTQAELGLAKAAQALNSFWDQATSSARIAAVGFLMPFFTVAYTYIPLIAQAATRNFTIMTAAFKPLIAWATGPGVAIFKNLENLFAASIPVGVHALTQFVELLAKIANFAAPQTGSLLVSIDKFLTGLNTTSGFAKLEGVMTTMIGMFRDWWGLLKQVGITLFDLFSQSVGLGTKIVTTITAMLVKLDAWLTSTSGKASVHNLFAVHLQEVLALLAILPTLVGAFGRVYLAVAPTLTILATGLADVVGWMLKIPVAGPILAWALAIGVLAKTTKIFAIGAWVAGAIASIAKFGAALVGFVAEEGIAGIATIGFGAAATALGVALDIATGPIGLIAGAIAALGVGLFLLISHWKQVTDFLGSTWGQRIQVALAVLVPFIGIPLIIITHWKQILSFFQQLPGWIMNGLKALPGLMLRFFEAVPGAIWTFLTSTLPKWIAQGAGMIGGLLKGLVQALPTITKFFIELPLVIIGVMGYIAVFLVVQGVKAIAGFVSGLVKAAPTVWNWFIALPGRILGFFGTVATWLWNVAVSLITGFLGGIKKGAPTVWNWFLALPGVILGLLTKIPGLLLSMGEFLITGLFNGIVYIWKNVGTWFTNLPGVILGFFKGAGTWLFNIGKAIIQGLWNGLLNIWHSVTGWVGGIGSWITSHKGPISADAVLLYPHGQAIMQGLHNGLKSGIPPILATLTNLSSQMGSAISGRGALSVSGTANASILHSLATASSPPMLSPALGSASGSGNQSISVSGITVNVNVPPGTPAQVAQQVGGLTHDAVNQAVGKAIRLMKGGARTYGFVPS